jgi:lipoprotein-releasing system permease protein
MQLKPFIVSGHWPKFNDTSYSKDLLVSAQLAKQLKIALNDTIRIYFISTSNGSRNYRKLAVSGIFKTGIEDYDKLFVIGDQQLIRRMSGWADDETGGYEIFVNDYHQMDSISGQLKDNLPAEWMSKTVQEIYPNIFDWLNIQDVNRNVIFIVMAIVAIINLITCLLILILERTRMVGVLKALGANDWLIQKLFLYHATVITFTGIGIGFVCGIGLCLLQKYTGFIKLDESAYYVSEAPIYIIWWQVFAICAGTTLICYLALIIPTWLIKRIQPTKAIQFR